MNAAPPGLDVPPPRRILEAAIDHVRRHGAGRTTIVSIAAAAGMTHANVYRYYPSKEALFDEISAGWMRVLEGEFRIVTDAPDPADDKLERLILAAASRYRQLSQDDPHLFALAVDAASAGRAVARAHAARLRTAIERAIEEGAASRIFDIKDRARSSAFVLDAAHRFLDLACVAHDGPLTRGAFDQRLGMLTRAIRRQLAARWR